MSKATPLYFKGTKLTHAVADLGSDPNSAHHISLGQRSHPELGSDPNSAGHANTASCNTPSGAAG
jgi:hypothetical protein